MLNKTQIEIMLTLQNQMNCTVDSNWKDLGRDWLLAAAMEANEAIGHHGWKWWKKQRPDMEQLQMELVDIWHFFLSVFIEDGSDSEHLVPYMESHLEYIDFNGDTYRVDHMNLVQMLKLLSAGCLTGTLFLELFMRICDEAGLSQESLYKQYIGKNILNMFRQKNGYKDGSYIKIWDGEEDNVHLVRIMDTLDINDSNFVDELSDSLVAAYTQYN